MKTRLTELYIALTVVALHAHSLMGDPQQSQVSDQLPQAWVAECMQHIDGVVERVSTAYQLSPDAAAALRSDLIGKIESHWTFEQSEISAVTSNIEKLQESGASADSPEVMAQLEKFANISRIGPLNDNAVATTIEAGISPDLAESGRIRLQELILREQVKETIVDQDLDTMASHNGDMEESRTQAVGAISVLGNPLPRGEKLANVAPEVVGKTGESTIPSTPVQPNAGVAPISAQSDSVGMIAAANTAVQSRPNPDMNEVKAAANALLADPARPAGDAKTAVANGRTAKVSAAKAVGADRITAVPPVAHPTGPQGKSDQDVKDRGPSRTVPNSAEAVRLQAAPPLDDWDKYVDTTCKKFGFTDSQVIKAQSILKDLRNRAAAYRSSRNEDFAAAERLADAKAKADRKKELSAPIDAFFEELKQRLDNLATLEQRAKAAAPVPGKK